MMVNARICTIPKRSSKKQYDSRQEKRGSSSIKGVTVALVSGGLKADENDRSSKGIKANSLTAFS